MKATITNRANAGEETKPRRVSIWKLVVPDFKLTFALWLPLYIAVMWYGIRQGFPSLGLFAIAMAAGIWAVGDAAVLTYRKVQEYQAHKGVGTRTKALDRADDPTPKR